jgi:hypothetical protein
MFRSYDHLIAELDAVEINSTDKGFVTSQINFHCLNLPLKMVLDQNM